MKNIITLPTHCDYDAYLTEIKKVRDCVEGAAKVKRENYTYLPHPSQRDQNSAPAQQRYVEFLAGAEFDEQPGDTLQTMLGKMRINEAEFDLPGAIEYLERDADGDGQSLAASIEYAVSNVIQAKYQIVVADYMGLSGVDLESVSLADRQELNPRAALKHYNRESVVNWHFSRVNGRMQLSWICLLERGSEFDYSGMCHNEVLSYLILALDENGDYYQQKIVSGKGGREDGERVYIQVNGSPLKFIPLEIISDQEKPSGEMPKGTGFLSRICNASLHKYQESAVYKEVKRNLSPTLMTKGWKRGDMDTFKEINGRDYVATGGNQVNNLPMGVEYDILTLDDVTRPFEWYFEYCDKKILSMGGVAKQEAANMTATEADINAAEQNAKLKTIADNVEQCFERLLSYCAMFEGIIQPNTVQQMDDIIVALPRDFATPKLTVEEVQTYMQMKSIGEMSPEEFDRQMKKGGWRSKDMNISEIEESPPVTPVTPQRDEGLD
jgi:hypothetical protein